MALKQVRGASCACQTRPAALAERYAPRWRRWLRAIGLALSAAVVLQPALGQGTGGASGTGLRVSVPNGYATVRVDDLHVMSTAGQVRWLRVWDGHEWKFNPQWESLSQSWANLTGSQTPDTTPGTVPGKSVESSGGGGGGGGGGCWMWVDEDWQPTYKTKTGDDGVTIVVEVGPMVPLRTTPFNRVMGEVVDDYITLRIVAPSMIGSGGGGCGGGGAAGAGTAFGGGSDNEAEGIRRINELYLGEKGRYTFNNRSILEKRPVQQLPSGDAGSLYAAIATGKIALAPATNAKGYRWMDRGGDWIDYNTQGQIVAWGDRNNNIVWLQRDSGGKVLAAIDANGRVLFSLHYSGELITEVRDYPIAGLAGDLPARSVKYQYDNMNRLVQVTDVRGNTVQYAYDGRHNIVQVTDQEGRVEKLAYNDQVVKQRIAPDGGVTDYLFEYDDVNKQFISKVTGPETAAGRRVDDLTHNRVGKLVRRIVNGRTDEEVRYDTGARTEVNTNARGFVTRTTRDEFDQVTTVANPDGTTTKRAYSALHLQLTEESDELGVKTQYQYDARGNLLKSIDAVGTAEERTTEYVRNGLGQLTQVTRKGRTEPNGSATADATWQVEYDAQGQIAKTTDPEGSARRYTYDRAGNLAAYTDPLGNATRYEVDSAGNLTKITDALGRERSYQVDKLSNVTAATDARAKRTQASYDALNRRVTLTNPVGGTYRLQYNAQGLPVAETDEDGRVSRAEFDNFLRITKQIDGLGNVTQYSYTIADGSATGSLGALFNPVEVQYPTFVQRQGFDERERPTTETLLNPNTLGTEGLVSGKTYDKRGQVKSDTDANGKTWFYSYDAVGRLTQITDSLGNKTVAQYDVRGNLIQIVDANGNVNKFEFDRNDRVTKEILPLGQTTQYQYDAAGNLTQKVDANGYKAEYAFDAANRVTKITRKQADGTLLRTVTVSWDVSDNLAGWTDTDHSRGQTSTTSRSFDDADRKTSETVTFPAAGGTTYTLSYGYGYSLGGKKTRLTWPDNTQIDYSYSAHGELEAITIPGEGSINVSKFKWFEPAAVSFPGGTTQERTLDGLLYLENMKVRTPGQQTILNLANTWGKVQELKAQSRTDTAGSVSSTKSSSFAYDDETRLTQATTDTGGLFGTDTERYTLDAVGNRIAHSKVAGAWMYDANNRLTQRGTGASATTYKYDAVGNLIEKAEAGGMTTRYAYDAQNRLTDVKDGQGNPIARYGYDPLDRRLWKEQYRDKAGQALAQPIRTYYLHGDEGLIAESTQAITLNADGSITASAAPAITTQYGPRPDSEVGSGALFIKTRNSAGQDSFAYYHLDQLRTPVLATDKTGNIVWSASYNAFGKASITTPAATAEVPTITSNLRLPGQYEDQETGLHYNTRRYYDPETGRYITQDPIGMEGGLNQYQYAYGDPVNVADPTGECPHCAAFAVCMAACALETAAENALTGDCNNWGNTAKDCAVSCALGMGLGKAWQWGKKLWDNLPCPVNSFSGDTLVHVRPKNGNRTDALAGRSELMPISQIRVGDEVVALADWKDKGSQANQDQRLSYEKVSDIFTSFKEQTLVHITLVTGQMLTATEGHPFKTMDGWRDALLLKRGSQLILKGGETDSARGAGFTAEIIDIRTERKTLPVFNLEVANVHTYLVGIDGQVVHNGRCTPAMRRAWEKLHGREWPKNPMDEKIRPGGNQDGHHIDPVVRGGDKTDPRNITPMTPSQHMDWHKKNGYR